MEERAHIQGKHFLEKEEAIKTEEPTEDGKGYMKPPNSCAEKEEVVNKEESTEDQKVSSKPSDVALKSAEYDEVWIPLTRTDLFMLTAVEEDRSSRVYRPPLLLQYGPRSQLFKYWSKHQQHRAWFHW